MNSDLLNIEFLKVKDAAYRYAAALLHDSVEAEDAVQDLYERLWRRRLLIRSTGFRALVMSATRNLCLDRLRARERQRHLVPIDSAEVATTLTAHSLESESATEELGRIARRIIEALPQREREVMHLREVEELPFAEVARVMGINEAAARMAASRARQRVKDELSKVIEYGL